MKSVIDGMFNPQYRARIKKKNFAQLKNKIDLMYCPKCNKMIQYNLIDESKERTCPKCGHFFTPLYSNRMKHISMTDWDSPATFEGF